MEREHAMDHDVVYVERHGDGIASIVLNQPKKRNAISARMMDMLDRSLVDLDAEGDVRVIVLRGAGDVFSSGGDLDQGGSSTMEDSRNTLKRYLRAVRTLRGIAKPVVAMVDGFAIGGAFSLVLASDLVCVSNRARFITMFCKIGIIPEMGMMKFLPDLVGAQRAKELLFLGGELSAQQVYDMGLANRICEPEALEEETFALARSISLAPAMSVRITKGIMNSSADPVLDMVMEAESTASPFCTQTVEYREMLARFLGK